MGSENFLDVLALIQQRVVCFLATILRLPDVHDTSLFSHGEQVSEHVDFLFTLKLIFDTFQQPGIVLIQAVATLDY